MKNLKLHLLTVAFILTFFVGVAVSIYTIGKSDSCKPQLTIRDTINYKIVNKKSLNKRELKEFKIMVKYEVTKVANHFDFNNIDLILSLIKQESQYNYKAVSPTGAEGLMQFTEITLVDYNHDVYDYKKTIYNGVKYLSRLKSLFKNRNNYSDRDAEILAVASYNCGRGRILRDKFKITKKETINYVKIIFNNDKRIYRYF